MGVGLVALLWLSSGCGPLITPEGDTGSSSEASTTSTPPSPTTGVGPTTAATAMTSVGDVSSGGVGVDTSDSGMPPDFPEYCSTIEQDCPRGYKCMPYASDGGGSWNDTRCVPVVDDPSAAGEPCTVVGNGLSGEDDCDGASMCWDVDPKTNEGTCAPFCIGDRSDPTCPDPCDYCTISGDGVLTLCLSACDPLVQDCGAGEACYPINQAFVCAPDASPEGAGIGSACEFINVCPPGMACLTAAAVPGCIDGAVGCCAPYCPVGGADPCPGLLPGSMCTPWYDEGDGPAEGCVLAPTGVCVQ